MAFYISQSLIKKMIHIGTEIPHCPHQIYYSYMVKKFPDPTSEAMLKGKYFESLAIGGTAHGGDLVLDLPRKRVSKKILKKNPDAIGEKTLAQIRIEEQAEKFKELAEKYGIVYNEYNTQTVVYKKYDKDPRVLLRGEFDIGPTLFYHNGTPYLSIVDLKLTGNIAATYGKFAWGNFEENIDKLQADMYLYLLKDLDFDLNDKLNPGNNLRILFNKSRLEMVNQNLIQFIWWVFDYKPEYSNKFFIHKNTSYDKHLFHETMRKTIAMLEFMHKTSYKPNPSLELCEKCNVRSCKYYNNQFNE